MNHERFIARKQRPQGYPRFIRWKGNGESVSGHADLSFSQGHGGTGHIVTFLGGNGLARGRLPVRAGWCPIYASVGSESRNSFSDAHVHGFDSRLPDLAARQGTRQWQPVRHHTGRRAAFVS